jgi:fatty acid CoA ligase FadD36
MLLTSLDSADAGAVDSAAAITIGTQNMSRAQLVDAARALAGSEEAPQRLRLSL